MKKFSTAAMIPALATAIALLAAPPVLAAGNGKCEFLKNAPDKHTVVKGDTLWGISGKFLEHPWCWPQVWGMNKAQIRNPHWIYPGQVVYLDRAAGRLRLGTPTGSSAQSNGAPQDVRLSPRIRSTQLDKDAVPTIAEKVLEPFLTQALIIEENELDGMPRIVATTESHVNIGRGDRAYVRGDLGNHEVFQVFRPAVALKDPGSKKILGYEAAYLGTAKLVRAAKGKDEAHAFTVTNAQQEMGVGDYLVPMPPRKIVNYAPHPAEEGMEVRIVSIYGGVSHAGQYQAVSINRGKNSNLDVGTVLTLYRTGQVIADRTNDKRKIRLPDEKYGTLFVFRVFNNMSYALIMEVTDTVQVGDIARTPE
ncbi:MAG: LysM peptidoglycan-binding domain-containing protein [Burkholderiaceae bacterium]|nr:LysM peptidoglycan-binding domain-containing protein [Burkholderiaceae bacterium]